jgi:hypothetical protein
VDWRVIIVLPTNLHSHQHVFISYVILLNINQIALFISYSKITSPQTRKILVTHEYWPSMNWSDFTVILKWFSCSIHYQKWMVGCTSLERDWPWVRFNFQRLLLILCCCLCPSVQDIDMINDVHIGESFLPHKDNETMTSYVQHPRHPLIHFIQDEFLNLEKQRKQTNKTQLLLKS